MLMIFQVATQKLKKKLNFGWAASRVAFQAASPGSSLAASFLVQCGVAVCLFPSRFFNRANSFLQ
jgi:hypothetical protein